MLDVVVMVEADEPATVTVPEQAHPHRSRPLEAQEYTVQSAQEFEELRAQLRQAVGGSEMPEMHVTPLHPAPQPANPPPQPANPQPVRPPPPRQSRIVSDARYEAAIQQPFVAPTALDVGDRHHQCKSCNARLWVDEVKPGGNGGKLCCMHNKAINVSSLFPQPAPQPWRRLLSVPFSRP